MPRFVREKSLKQRMDFQQSQCKSSVANMASLSEEKSLKQRMDFQQSSVQQVLPNYG